MTLFLRSGTGTLHIPALIDHKTDTAESVCSVSAVWTFVGIDLDDLDDEQVCQNCRDDKPEYVDG